LDSRRRDVRATAARGAAAEFRQSQGAIMTDLPSAGARFRAALQAENPLQVVGAVNAYTALLAQSAGFRAIYLSGAGVANASLGLPDLAITTLNDVLIDIDRITNVTPLPLMVDVDTGFGAMFNIARTVKALIKRGAAALHMEDQVAIKRCGHRPGKAVVPTAEMVDRIKAAVDARTDSEFFIIARTDALAVEGIESAIERALACKEAGADGVFAEAVTQLPQYARFASALGGGYPLLANMTEFSKTPSFSPAELRSVGVAIALYPLSAFRAQSAVALRVFEAIRTDGSVKAVLELMQSRDDLYKYLDYHAYERKIDQLYAKEKLKVGT
jgi:methylisocitrate lyase